MMIARLNGWLGSHQHWLTIICIYVHACAYVCLSVCICTISMRVSCHCICVMFFMFQVKSKEVLDKYDEEIHGEKREFFVLGE